MPEIRNLLSSLISVKYSLSTTMSHRNWKCHLLLSFWQAVPQSCLIGNDASVLKDFQGRDYVAVFGKCFHYNTTVKLSGKSCLMFFPNH